MSFVGFDRHRFLPPLQPLAYINYRETVVYTPTDFILVFIERLMYIHVDLYHSVCTRTILNFKIYKSKSPLNYMGKLEGKIALITGGNSGISLTAAKQFVLPLRRCTF
jgi:hypothetical protein